MKSNKPFLLSILGFILLIILMAILIFLEYLNEKYVLHSLWMSFLTGFFLFLIPG